MLCEAECSEHRSGCESGRHRPGHRLHHHGEARRLTLCIFGEAPTPPLRGFDPNAHIAPSLIVRELVVPF